MLIDMHFARAHMDFDWPPISHNLVHQERIGIDAVDREDQESGYEDHLARRSNTELTLLIICYDDLSPDRDQKIWSLMKPIPK
jgi:hypothetical protein